MATAAAKPTASNRAEMRFIFRGFTCGQAGRPHRGLNFFCALPIPRLPRPGILLRSGSAGQLVHRARRISLLLFRSTSAGMKISEDTTLRFVTLIDEQVA